MGKKPTTAIAPRETVLLSGKAQNLYNQFVDLKEDARVVKEKRQRALMKNERYAELKEQAAKLVKEATEIQQVFDVENPGYKRDIGEITNDTKKVAKAISAVAIEAIRKGVELEVYDGNGRARQRVNWKVSVQPSLF